MTVTAASPNRRSLLVAGTAGVAAVAWPSLARAAAPEFQFRFANNAPATHPMNVRAGEAAARIARDSGGRVELLLFPGAQLGSDADVLSQLRSGGIDLLAISGPVASTLVPNAAVTGMGFAFDDYPAVWRALDGALGAYVRAEFLKVNLLAFPKAWDNGFRQMTSANRPLRSVDDLKGFKMRVPVSPLWTSMFKALGAAPTGIAPPELYSSLQTGIVDGQENALVGVLFAKFYEVQKYCALTDHMWDGYWTLANRAAHERWPKDVQALVQRHLEQAALDERADVERLGTSARAELERRGLKFTTPDKGPFRERLRQGGFYGEWKARLGKDAWTALEASVGPVA